MRIKKSFIKLENILNKEVDTKVEKPASPLFKRQENEFLSLHHENIFYGYSHPKSSRSMSKNAQSARSRSKSKDLVGKIRPMSAAKFELTEKSAKKNRRPITAVAVTGLGNAKYTSTINQKSLKEFQIKSKFRTVSSGRKPAIHPNIAETTSSFWNDDFTFRNRSLSSQRSEEITSPSPPDMNTGAGKILLTRKKTGVVGIERKIHHGTLEMSLNELKNIFKLRYEHRFEAPIDGIIFKLGINENCPQINCNIID